MLEKINPLVADLLAANPFLTTKMLSKEVYKALNLKVSSCTCSRSVRYNNFTYKRTRLQDRKDSYSEIESSFKQAYLQAKKIVSIDETFFYYNEYPRYGYSKKGKQLKHAIKDNPKKKKLTLYMAVDENRIVGYKLSTTNGNSSDFLDFLKSLNLANSTVLMDNVAFHKTKTVRDYIQTTKSTILFVPPYSPDYNPIEMVFSKLKAVYRSLENEFNLAVVAALDTIKNDNMNPYFEHVQGLVSKN